MLQPKKVKFRKLFRGKICGNENKVLNLAFGNLGVKALKSGRLTLFQAEALRTAILKKTKGKGKIWLRVFPHFSNTSKPAEIRMGKGKGNVNFWYARVYAGRILVEFQGIPKTQAKVIIKSVSNKLNLNVKLVHIRNSI